MHVRQSVDDCVTCPRRWHEHTAEERTEAGRCNWLDGDMRTVCGDPLPCSRHGHDREGHPFGFTVYTDEAAFEAAGR